MIARILRLTDATPIFVQLTFLFYLLHILCQGWIGSSQGFLSLAVITGFAAAWRRELLFPFHPLYVPFALFLIGSVASALGSHDRIASLLEVTEWLSFATIPIALALYRRLGQRAHTAALHTMIALGIFQASFGILQYTALGRRDLEHRITGTAAHVMTYSGILLPISLLALILFLRRKTPLLLIGFLLPSIALILTFTRGAWLGWVAGFIALLLLRRSRWFFYSIPLLVLLVTFLPLDFFARFLSTFDLRQTSNFDRVRMIEAGAEIIEDHALLGVGPGQIKEIYPLYRHEDAPRFRIPHLHNNVIQLWAERGILALVAYLLLLVIVLRECFRGRRVGEPARSFADVGIVTTVALSCAGLFEFNFGDTEVLLMMLDIFALVLFRLETGPTQVEG